MTLVGALLVFNEFFIPACLISSVWLQFTNYRTHEDRFKILAAMRDRPMTGPQLLTELEKVDYQRHFNARLLLRDPWKLYDPMILDSIKNPRTEIITAQFMPAGMDGGPPERVH